MPLSFPTTVKSFEECQRALIEVKKALEELIEKQPKADKNVKEDEKDGVPGSIRVIKNSEEESLFEIKTEDGWKKPMVGETPVTFKKLESNTKDSEKKSITELAGDDTNTGESIAKNTIYDEKNKKFIMPRPDFDSGWLPVPAENTSNNVEHGFENLDPNKNPGIFYVVYIRDALDDTADRWKLLGENQGGADANDVLAVSFDKTKFYYYNDSDDADTKFYWANGPSVTFETCSLRILAWK